MIRPTRYEIACDAWDCDPERFAPMSRPLTVDASSVPQAGAAARRAGWMPSPGRGGWWCPRHAQIATHRRASLGSQSGT